MNWLKRKENFIPIILFVLAVLPFLFNLRDFFLSDDWDFLAQVAGQHQPLWRYFFTNYVGTHAGGSYRPLVIYFWLAAHHLWQLNYFWYHFIQIILHAANVVLLYSVILNFVWPDQKKDRFAWAVASAAIFALLPDHSEAVAWLAAVADPLCTFFFLASLLSLLFCLKYYRAKFWLYAGSLLFFCAALFAKEMAMSLPFIILIFVVYYFWQNRSSVKAAKLLFAVPYFILLAGYFWLRYRAIGLFFGYYGEDHLRLGFDKIAAAYSDVSASFILSDNWRTIFSLWLNNNLAVILSAVFLFLAALLYLTWKKKWSVWPWLIFLSLGISLVPVASFGINLTQTYFSEDGERYGYLPSLFFAVLAAAGVAALLKKISANRYKKIAVYFIIILFLAGLAGQLLIKNQRYQQAAFIAQKALHGAVAQMRQGDYAGVLFFGLPDNFHGAPIFRNGWQEAIAFYLPDPPAILAPFNRSAYESGQKFMVEKTAENTYNYASADGKLILAKPQFSSADYSTVLDNYIFEPTGINDRYFGDKLDIKLSDNLAGNEKVALFFWNGIDWKIISAK
jgi:hypothetical protein